MTILIVTDKPFVSRNLAGAARRRWPTEKVTFVHLAYFSNVKFAYPRGNALADYPQVSTPRYKLTDWASWVQPPLVLQLDGSLQPAQMSTQIFNDAETLMLVAGDESSAHRFKTLITSVLGPIALEDCLGVSLVKLPKQFSESDLDQAFDTPAPFEDVFSDELLAQDVRQYFDWNWNINAAAILGAIARSIGVPDTAPRVSKYGLQLLFALQSSPPLPEGAIVEKMYAWKGSGRYKPSKDLQGLFGSPTSRGAILHQMLEAGFITADSPSKYRLSTQGHAFLNALHPDCADADLPFRLKAWSQEGLVCAGPKIDRYIHTFFGKAKRFRGTASASALVAC